jgi:hypothetical protein
LGYNPSHTTIDTTTPAGIGNVTAEALLTEAMILSQAVSGRDRFILSNNNGTDAIADFHVTTFISH